jgi:hypothetical protein
MERVSRYEYSSFTFQGFPLAKLPLCPFGQYFQLCAGANCDHKLVNFGLDCHVLSSV